MRDDMKKYSIGEVSSQLGLSRDTIRFYEKKGIIQPEKGENGYRSYTHEDTRKLLDVIFYRKLNFSLEDINRILHESSFPTHFSMIEDKISEEKRLLKQHRESLIRLKYLKQIYKNVQKFLGSYDIRPMKFYKMKNSTLIEKLEIFDFCYVYQEYQMNGDSADHTDEYFLFPAKTGSVLGIEQPLKHQPVLEHEQCVYTVIASDKRTLRMQDVTDAMNWAKEQGYTPVGTAYSGYLLSCAYNELQQESKNPKSKSPIHYIELYIPVKTNAAK
jgi:DNA-binding transcriptional MerR regulator